VNPFDKTLLEDSESSFVIDSTDCSTIVREIIGFWEKKKRGMKNPNPKFMRRIGIEGWNKI
jgi:hypothetical protein